uniref:cyclin-dependent kinase n=1 Tax=Ixodes ricinus TaxID=34613 RepID=A0A131YAN0_IXORI
MSRSSNDSEEDGEIDREETRYNVYAHTVSPGKEYLEQAEDSESYDTEDGGEDTLNIQPPQATIIPPKRDRRDRKRDKHSRKHESSSRSRAKERQHSSRDRGGGSSHREGSRRNQESGVGSRGGSSRGAREPREPPPREPVLREPREYETGSRHRQHRQEEKPSRGTDSRARGDAGKEQQPARTAASGRGDQPTGRGGGGGGGSSREAKESASSRADVKDAREKIREAKEAREAREAWEREQQREREEREQERLQREWRKERLLVVDQSVLQREREREQRKEEAQRAAEGSKPAQYSAKSGNGAPRDRSRSPLPKVGGATAPSDDRFDNIPVISLDIEDDPLTDMEEEMESPTKAVQHAAEATQEAQPMATEPVGQPAAQRQAVNDDDDDDSDLSTDSSSDDDSSDSDDSSSSDDDSDDDDDDDDDDEKDTEDENVAGLNSAAKNAEAVAQPGIADMVGAASPLSEDEDESLQLPPYLPAIQGCRSVEEFHCLNRIEEGTYGVVYRARDKQTDEIVALKRLKMEKEKEGFPITSLREINTLLKAQHPNIVTVREIVVGSNMDKIYIVMDYVEHDLKSLMEVMKQPFLVGEVKTLMLQLLKAVAHLHDNWILHRDLKTSNLLLSHKGILKVGDFGLAREYGSPLKHYTPIVVTMWYRAPELLLGVKEYSTPIDMWSVGCIFGELLTMKPLFPGKSDIDQLNRIFKDLGTPSEKIWPGYTELPLVKKVTFTEYPYNNLRSRFGHTLSNLGFDLLNKFLTYYPSRRSSAEEALRHEFFQETPVPVDPSMFPTWPAKSELGHRKAPSPKPPSGGKQFAKQLGDGEEEGLLAAAGFHMNIPNKGSSAKGTGFSLKF